MNVNEVTQLMTDPDFRRQLRQHDSAAFSKLGLDLGSGDTEYKVITTQPGTMYFPIPASPSDGELSADDLESVQAAGGGLQMSDIGPLTLMLLGIARNPFNPTEGMRSVADSITGP